MHYDHYRIAALLALLGGCSSSPSDNGAAADLGGSSATGGATAAGGRTSMGVGGDPSASGGSSTSSSPAATGGSIASGGSLTDAPSGGSSGTTTQATGGLATGGSHEATGGNANTGGNSTSGNAGGSQSIGGTPSSVTVEATGGVKATGGTSATGGSSTNKSSLVVGGTTGSGGSKNTGGTSATSGGTGTCSTPPAPSELVGWASVDGGTTGGGNATPVVVTTLADLQNAVKGTTAAVVYVKGVLAPGVVTIGSNKTIVGLCGAEIHGHVGLNKSSNVIIRNIRIVGYAVGDCSLDPDYSSGTGCSSGEDAITVQGQSTHLWFDHCDISDGTDGNLDITHASDYITVSWTKFHYTPRTDNQGSDSTGASGHRYSNLIGGSDSNGAEDTGHLRVTWHHDWWADNVVERQPRVRFGQVHIFNNLWTSSATNYCIGLGVSANVRTENNVFIGVKTPINATSYSDSKSAVRSTGNVYTSTGSTPGDVNASSVFDPASSYTYALDATNALEATIRSGAGPK